MDKNRPTGRKKNVTGSTGGVSRRGSGLGTGPVGTTNGRKNSGGSSAGSSGSGMARKAGGSSLGVIVLLVLFFLGKSFLGGGSNSGSSIGVGDILGSGDTGNSTIWQQTTSTSDTGSDWNKNKNTGVLDTSVAKSARDKRTEILGNGKDTVTIMVYMCGTDLESRSGMATSDLVEMTKATISDKVNLVVYTGGCTQWKNEIVSSTKNQIYQIKNGGLVCLESDMGTASMTNPATLTEFIQYCSKNFPANRNDLIFWDHGGGSITGYGYDEKNKSSGSMNLAGINKALKDGGVTYDFIGFDACLMATLETALTMSDYADYLIASEETEPGVGWYYTNWLTELSQDTSKATIEIGKKIVDDFVDVCAQKCSGQKTTLSVVDLAELEMTVPSEFKSFAKATNQLIKDEEYQTVADARYNSREFAVSSKIDQVDLVNLAENMGTAEGNKLSKVIKGAVKYNRTSKNMTDAYGLAIYFPYKKTSTVNTAASVYDQIGIDSEYSSCIKEFAGLEVSGQQTTGGSNTSPLDVLLGGGSGSSGSANGNIEMITTLLGGLLGSDSSFDFLSGRSISEEETAQYLAAHYFDPNGLVWTQSGGAYKIVIPEDQWELIHQVDLNVFVDDGEGFIDLGLDNVYEWDEQGNLLGKYDGSWLTINDIVVAYYHTDTIGDADNYYITGYVPVLLNGERAELLLEFTNENPNGYVTGVRRVYVNGETGTIAKNDVELGEGDVLTFIADYYAYDGTYLDTYAISDSIVVSGELKVADQYFENANKAQASYRFKDIYEQTYWTPVIP